MCNHCGYTPCTCSSSYPSFNWQNIDNYPCNPCSQTEVCKKFIPAKCVIYKGSNSSCDIIYGLDIQTIIGVLNNKICDLQTQIALCCNITPCPTPTNLTNVN